MSAFDQIRQAYFGSTRLPGHLTPQALRRVLLSVVPGAVIVVASVLHAVLQLVYSNYELGFPGLGYPGEAPAFWRRADAAAEALISFSSLAVALLFATGVRNWTRSEGAWVLLIGLVLAGSALALALFVVGGFALFSTDGLRDLKMYIWQQLGITLGFLSIGYFFLAYRGASAPEEPGEAQGEQPHGREPKPEDPW
jgi:hypothetical protein